MSLPQDHEDVNTVYEKLYSDYIEALDAHDNGMSVYEPQQLAASGLEKRFRDGGINLGSLIGDMNYPDPNEPEDEDTLFAKASTFIGETFLRKLRGASGSWLPARSTVHGAYASRREIHPSGRLMIMPKAGVPWKEHLYSCERQSAEGDGSESNPEVYYVLYPESAAPDSKWRVQCVPVTDASFESRKPLPDPWRGARDEELDKILAKETETQGGGAVPEGAIFVHASGFIGGHKTREGALAMAIRSLERNS
jgi:uncharacterized UPF0160 family protein